MQTLTAQMNQLAQTWRLKHIVAKVSLAQVLALSKPRL
jgi:hypothetical protein